jgi:hypothetical protein
MPLKTYQPWRTMATAVPQATTTIIEDHTEFGG